MNLAPMKNFLNWFESRLHLAELITPSATHSVPTSAKWWYVFGSMTLTLFILQITTGICLSLAYVPSGSQAWESLMYMNYELYMGWFLRAMHVWGSHLMLTFMTIHYAASTVATGAAALVAMHLWKRMVRSVGQRWQRHHQDEISRTSTPRCRDGCETKQPGQVDSMLLAAETRWLSRHSGRLSQER